MLAVDFDLSASYHALIMSILCHAAFKRSFFGTSRICPEQFVIFNVFNKLDASIVLFNRYCFWFPSYRGMHFQIAVDELLLCDLTISINIQWSKNFFGTSTNRWNERILRFALSPAFNLNKNFIYLLSVL